MVLFQDNLGKTVKGKTSVDLGGFGMQWHQLDHMQTVCNQQYQSTEGQNPAE